MSESDSQLDLERVRAVLNALSARDVDYAVFGAVALGLHGLSRATLDIDLFVRPDAANIERLRDALMEVFSDPSLAEISAEELCGEYPAVRYHSDDGLVIDIVTRLGDAFRHEDLEIENVEFEGLRVRVVSPRTLWLMKKDTLRPKDRIDAAALAEQFGFADEMHDGD